MTLSEGDRVVKVQHGAPDALVVERMARLFRERSSAEVTAEMVFEALCPGESYREYEVVDPGAHHYHDAKVDVVGVILQVLR